MNQCGRSGFAVGLSAISLLAPSPPRSLIPVSRFPFPIPVPIPAWLAKDAAPIPNAFESTSLQVNESKKNLRSDPCDSGGLEEVNGRKKCMKVI